MTDERSASREEQTSRIADRIGELRTIALRTLELAEPITSRIGTTTEWSWREPSRLLTITLSPKPFMKGGRVISIDVRSPGKARTITIDDTDGTALRASMRRDPVEGARRLLDEVRMAVTSSASLDRTAQDHADLGRTLALAERLGVADREWTITHGSILHGPGRIESFDDLGNRTTRGTMPGHGPIRITSRMTAFDDLIEPSGHPNRQPERSPLLCTLARRTEPVRFDQHDAATRLRALADHMRTERP